MWEHYKRRRLDATQRLVVEVMMATAASGMWAAPTTGREMPRQNGKGDEIEVVELWGLVQRAERILHTVHDAVLLATETQSRLLSVIEGHADLRRLKLRAWRGTGQQMIELRNGGIIWYRTRTGGGARGVDEVDRVVVDEAQHAEEEHLAAITPTQFASANPQLNALGTAGIAGKSAWWWAQRIRSLSPAPGNFGYIGHTAEELSLDPEGRVMQPPVDVEDRALWRDTNPSLQRDPAKMAFLEEQYLRLGGALFAREHLGVWDPPPNVDGAWHLVPVGAWRGCERVGHKHNGSLMYGVDADVNPAGEVWVSIGCSDGVHVEVVTPPETGPGTAWAVPAIVKRASEVGELVIDPNGPAGVLVAPLEKAGVSLRKLTGAEVAQASAQFLDAVIGGTVRHIDQPRLNTAAAGVVRRDVGDGAWRFSRTRSNVDISPLLACSFARWAAVSTKPPVDAAANIH